MRSLSLSLVLLLAITARAQAQCSAAPSITELPVPDVPLPGQATAIVARAAAIEAMSTSDPARPLAMLELALAYRATGDRASSVRTLARIVEAHPAFASMDRVLLELGRDLFAMGRGEQARTVFFQLIRNHPASPWVAAAYSSFGDFYFSESDFAAAAQFYERATSTPGGAAAYAHYRLAWAQAHLGRADAVLELDRARTALASPDAWTTPALTAAIQSERAAVAARIRCP